MTIRDSMYFTYNGQKSKNFKMLNVSIDGGMQEEYFASSQTIIEQKIRGRNKPYFYGTEKSPLSITVTFAYDGTWDETDLRALRRWLTEPEYYVPLTFSNNNEKIYYVLYEDEPNLVHSSLSQGYITLRFRGNDSYAYSPLMLHPEQDPYDWNQNNVSVTVEDFSSGVHKQTVVNVDNKLSLNNAPMRWSDLPLHLTWREMFANVL